MDEELEKRMEKISEDLSEAKDETISSLMEISAVAQRFIDEEKELPEENRAKILKIICIFEILVSVLES